MARLSPGSSAVPRTLASLATPTIFTHRFWKISGSSMKSVSYLHIRGSPRHFLSPAFSGRGSISPLPSCSFPHCICQFKQSPVAVTNDPNPRGLQQPVRGGSAEIRSTPSSLQDPAGPEQTTPPGQEEAMLGAWSGSSPSARTPHTSLPLDFTGESKSPGQACPEGAEVTTHLQGWTGLS